MRALGRRHRERKKKRRLIRTSAIDIKSHELNTPKPVCITMNTLARKIGSSRYRFHGRRPTAFGGELVAFLSETYNNKGVA